jgi:CDI immunity proteins
MTNTENKLEPNWRQQTLENLEKDRWDTPNFESHLAKRCHELRKVTLNKFTTEDLRIMIGQQIGLNYLIPLAIESLTNNLFSEGDFYPGDLLKSVLSVDTNFWNTNKEYWTKIDNLIKDRRQELMQTKISTVKFDASVNNNK